jgi:hypothetical protein
VSPPASPNGHSAPAPPSPVPPGPGATPPLSAAAALAAIPPDIQITLASGGSRGVSLSDRAKTWVTALIVLAAAGSDALFFPYAKYMVVYGMFVSVPSALAIWRLWGRRSVKP